MTKRLIDSAELIAKLPIVEKDKQISLIGAVADVVDMISECQPVDAVEVVRCAQCIYSRKLNRRHKKEKDFTSKCIWCNYYETGKLLIDYCSDGERKDGGQAPQREDV